MSTHRFRHSQYRIEPGARVDPGKLDTKAPKDFDSKKEIFPHLEQDRAALVEAQRMLWAHKKHAMLIIFQGLDASGKDGAIRHVMSGVNPQGCSVTGFRAPSEEEREHHFLWRPMRFLPARGRLAIFNRSYYEEVLVVRVHPEFLVAQGIASKDVNDALWERRFDEIAKFERVLRDNGTIILKFFLNHSRAEQKARFMERLDRPEKNWKFSIQDVKERAHWDDYRKVYGAMLGATSTKRAPWYAIPADDKWFARALIADIIAASIEKLHDSYPEISAKEREDLAEARRQLEEEE